MRVRWHGRRGFRAMAAGLVAAAVLIGFGPGAASASTCVSWTGLQPPSPGSFSNILNGVAVVSSCSAWAAGYFSSGTNEQTLIAHWDGSSWGQQSSPTPGSSNALFSVAATSATNAWAVGFYFPGTAEQTLIEHWNGSIWTQASSPNPGGSTHDNDLFGVAATSAADAWAVGEYSTATAGQSLIAHWNGTGWKQVASPNPGSSFSELRGVAAISATNAWAVGSYFNGTADQTLIAHWNGKAWTKVPSPNPGGPTHSNFLSAVAATSATSAWAVGYFSNGTADQTLIAHWNGKAWMQVPSPNPGSSSNRLTGVAAISAADVWAVGSYNSGAADQTMVANWNGKAWTRPPSPDPGGSTSGNDLFGVAATSSTNIWAVGGTGSQTLALHCC